MHTERLRNRCSSSWNESLLHYCYRTHTGIAKPNKVLNYSSPLGFCFVLFLSPGGKILVPMLNISCQTYFANYLGRRLSSSDAIFRLAFGVSVPSAPPLTSICGAETMGWMRRKKCSPGPGFKGHGAGNAAGWWWQRADSHNQSRMLGCSLSLSSISNAVLSCHCPGGCFGDKQFKSSWPSLGTTVRSGCSSVWNSWLIDTNRICGQIDMQELVGGNWCSWDANMTH